MKLIIIVAVIILLVAEWSDEITPWRKILDAICTIGRWIANNVSRLFFIITESRSEKEIRLAKEKLADRNGRLLRFDLFTDDDRLKKHYDKYLNSLLTIDKDMKLALNVLGLSEEVWKEVANQLLYIGPIIRMSRDADDGSRRNEKSRRKNILNDWSNSSVLKPKVDFLINALDYFGISKEEWIEYGDEVVKMHHLLESEGYKDYLGV